MSAPAIAALPLLDRGTPLGATIVADGATFRTWAPNARQVFLLTGNALAAARVDGFTPSANNALVSMGDGTWGALLPGVTEGSPYMFWVDGTGNNGLKRDPRARELTPVSPTASDPDASNCLVRSASSFPWHDQGFRLAEFRDLILYQLHVGVFYGVDANGHDKRANVAKFLDILDKVDYFRDLGVNAIQLMPIQEFPSQTSMGYNGVDLFSPEMAYTVYDDDLKRYLGKANALLSAHGQSPLTIDQLRPGPNQLKCLIDILHLNGIGVLFDLVYNHAGGGFGNNSIYFFDRQPNGNNNHSLYFTDQGWVGGLVFAYWNQDVCQFLIDNAVTSIEEYHIDGMRYDEVTVIDTHGGGRFCQDLTGTVRFVKPQAIQIAEYWGDDRAEAVRSSPSGLGFDAAWGDRLREGVRQTIGQSSVGRDAFVDFDKLAASLDTPYGFPGDWKVINCLENHDILYDGHNPRVATLADGSNPRSWFARSRARVAAGLLMGARGIPMLFMGEEFLADKGWNDNETFHPDLLINWDALASDKTMQDYLRFTQDLVRLRRNQPALRSDSLRVSHANSIDRVMAIHRWIEGQGDDLLIALNLQEFNRFGYRIGFPGGGSWREIFNSDFYDQFPNAGTTGNDGGVNADEVAWDGMPASAEITLPANGFVVFSR